jgi:hypothetical protein
MVIFIDPGDSSDPFRLMAAISPAGLREFGRIISPFF